MTPPLTFGGVCSLARSPSVTPPPPPFNQVLNSSDWTFKLSIRLLEMQYCAVIPEQNNKQYLYGSEYFTCVSRFTGAFVAIDPVDAGSIFAKIILAVVNIDFTVDSWRKRDLSFSMNFMITNKYKSAQMTSCALGTAADVGIRPVLACASVPAGLTQTLVDVGLAQPTGVSGCAVAAEGGQAVLAGAVVTRVRGALVDFCLTVLSSITWAEIGFGLGLFIVNIPGSFFFVFVFE